MSYRLVIRSTPRNFWHDCWILESAGKFTYPSLPANVLRGGESVISRIPDWTGLVVATNKGRSYMPGVKRASVTHYQQSISLQNGIVHTNATWKPHGQDEMIFQLNFTVLAHRKRINLGLVWLDLAVNQAANFTVTDVIARGYHRILVRMLRVGISHSQDHVQSLSSNTSALRPVMLFLMPSHCHSRPP